MPGTYFAGTSLSRDSDEAAGQVIASKIQAFSDQGIKVSINNELLSLNPEEIGIYFDRESTLDKVKFNSFNLGNLNFIQIVTSPFRTRQIKPSFNVDFGKLSNGLNLALNKYEKDFKNATITYEGGDWVLSDDEEGEIIDRSKLISDLRIRVENLSNEPVQAEKIQIDPEIRVQQASGALEKAKKISSQRITFTYSTEKWAIAPDVLSGALRFYPYSQSRDYFAKLAGVDREITFRFLKMNGEALPDLDLGLDPSFVKTFFGKISQEVNTAKVDASLRFEKGKVVEFTPARDGQEVDTEAARRAILDSFGRIDTTFEKEVALNLPVRIDKAKIENKEINDLGILEPIGKGVSYFNGSIANRIYNISLGAKRLNGTLVAPGETFYFNQSVGEVSGATGYRQAYVISAGRTVLDDGGGICQVSTTVFRAALNAGLPIVARTAHAYRVGYYEQGGVKPGFDATVWAPAVDFKFKNDTGKYVLVQAVFDGERNKLEVDLYGTSDGRRIEISDPVISNITPAPPDKNQEDPTLPKGTIKQVDFAAGGATSVFTRKVYKGNETLIDEVFRSNYRPWQAIFLVGTG